MELLRICSTTSYLNDQKLQTMAKLIHSAQSFMNAKDAIIAKQKKKALNTLLSLVWLSSFHLFIQLERKKRLRW